MQAVRIGIESIFKFDRELCDHIVAGRELNGAIARLTAIIFLAGGLYGAVMGFQHSLYQAISSLVKTPILFYLTLLICLPGLHFLGLLLGSRVSFRQSLAVILIGIAVTAVLLASFATIALFFLFTGSSYRFLLSMHVVLFAFAGLAGLRSIHTNFAYIRKKETHENTPRVGLLQIWMLLYMFVGTQTAFILSPFVGREKTFYLFHHPRGNFYSYLWQTAMAVGDPLTPETARTRVGARAGEALDALGRADFETFTAFMHPVRPLRVIPLTGPVGREGVEMSRKRLLFIAGQNARIELNRNPAYQSGPGESAGTRPAFKEFYERYLFDRDYRKAGFVSFNEFVVEENRVAALNVRSDERVTVEYVVVDRDARAERWSSLVLVFEPHEDAYFLTEIWHADGERP